MLLVVVTGPPGVGKSEVATAVHDALGEDGVSNALVEMDQLERSYPPLSRDRSMKHLATLTDSYREAGYRLLFVTATVVDDDYARAMFTAVGAQELLLARLEAEPATLRDRIVEREAGWSGLTALVEASEALSRSMSSLSGVDVVLSTEGRLPSDVAAELQAAVLCRVASHESNDG